MTSFAVDGDLDMASSDALVERISSSARREPVLLDLSGVGFVDSSGVRAFLRIAEWLDGKGCLILHGEKPAVRRVLDLLGIGGAPANIHRLSHDGVGDGR